jgi:hypothetical protein
MKRDMELVRKILFVLDNHESDKPMCPADIQVEGCEREAVRYHLEIMVDSGLLKTHSREIKDPKSIFNRVPFSPMYSMSWEGHDFIEKSRDPKRWESAMKVASTAGDVTVATLKIVLSELTKAAVSAALGRP